MSADPAGTAPQPRPLSAPQGRLVFDCSSAADSAVADELHDMLFPSEPCEQRRPLYHHQAGDDDSPASIAADGSTNNSEHESEEALLAPDAGDAASTEPWDEVMDDDEDLQGQLQEEEPLSAAALRVLERRQLTRERFARRQGIVREMQRRCGQHPARGAPVWSPPVLVYRPPPLPALQRRLLEPGELADTVPEPPGRTREQIQEFSRRHLQAETEDDTPR